MHPSLNPLAVVAAAYLIGVFAAHALDVSGGGPTTWGALGAFFAASLVAVWGSIPAAQGEPRRRLAVALWLLVAGALCAGLAVPSRAGQSDALPLPGMTRLEGVVEASRPVAPGRSRAVLRVIDGVRLEDGAQIAPGTHLSCGPAALPPGARVRLLAKVSPRMPFRNPTPHPELPSRFQIRGQAWVADPRAVEIVSASPFAPIETAREHVRKRLEATLPQRVAGVARALVLGDDSAVDESDAAQVRDAGLLHVFAVSGLHVAILAGLLVRLLQSCLLRWTAVAARFEVRRIACAAGVPLVLAYAAFAGGSPSAWRSACTAALAWTTIALGRRPSAVSMTAAAALVLAGSDPAAVVRPAFLLSVAATSAILGGQFRSSADLRAWLRDAIALSVRTTVATAPICLWCFGALPLAGVAANVVLFPFGALLLVQLSALHALACTLTPFAALTAAPFVLVSESFVHACAAFAQWCPPVQLLPLDLAQGLVASCSALTLLLLRRGRSRCVVVVLSALALGLCELRLRWAERPRGELRTTYLDVGQGDAALIDLPDGRLMLIDAGGNPGGGPDPGHAVLLPLLQARRRERIDIAVLTHPHPDHYGGLAALIDQIPITELWDSGQADAEVELHASAAETRTLLERARARGTRVLGPAELCEKPRRAGDARIAVLAPCPAHEPAFDPNDNSLIVRIEHGDHALLFMGDAEAHQEAGLLTRGHSLAASVLKVGHHGSRTSSGEAFVQAVEPSIAIISAGAGNRFGHPHGEVVERLRRRVPHVLNLGESGGVVVRSDGKTLRVRSWAGTELRPATHSGLLHRE
jgi:competence protein ComEC